MNLVTHDSQPELPDTENSEYTSGGLFRVSPDGQQLIPNPMIIEGYQKADLEAAMERARAECTPLPSLRDHLTDLGITVLLPHEGGPVSFAGVGPYYLPVNHPKLGYLLSHIPRRVLGVAINIVDASRNGQHQLGFSSHQCGGGTHIESLFTAAGWWVRFQNGGDVYYLHYGYHENLPREVMGDGKYELGLQVTVDLQVLETSR